MLDSLTNKQSLDDDDDRDKLYVTLYRSTKKSAARASPLPANPVVPRVVQKKSYHTESHHAAASGRSRPSYAITRGRREAHVGDQRVVLVCGPNRPHQIRRPSPRSRSPPLPPSRSAIADLLEASPSTQSLGPPPPVGREEGSMALLQRRIRRQRGTPPQRAPKVRLTRETYASSLPGDLIISA